MSQTEPIHLRWLDAGPHVVSAPELVRRHFEHDEELGSTEHMAVTILRKATREDIERWKRQC